jgi:hypothetical protein
MPDRKVLVSTLWFTSLPALLASVLVATIWTSGFVAAGHRPDCIRRSFALPLGQPTSRLSTARAADAVLRRNGLPSENEEQAEIKEKAEKEEKDPGDALDELRVSFLIPCSFPKVSDRQLIAPCSILSHYPLRC